MWTCTACIHLDRDINGAARRLSVQWAWWVVWVPAVD